MPGTILNVPRLWPTLGLKLPIFRRGTILSSGPFERGEITLDEYLDRTVFYRERPFTRQSFRDYMFAQSRPKPDVLAIARKLSKSSRYLMATINNESLDLNRHRIRTFALDEIFTIFVSSCFVRLRKPDRPIYDLALQLTQREADESCFLDDRPANLEVPASLGMQTIHVENAQQVAADLTKLGNQDG